MTLDHPGTPQSLQFVSLGKHGLCILNEFSGVLVLENCYIRAPQRRPQNTSLYCLWYPEGGGRSESLLESGPIPQTWTHSRQEGAYPLKRRQEHFRWMPAHGPSLKHLQVR